MTENRINILSTAPLDQQLLQLAKGRQINIEVIPFIHTKPDLTLQKQQQILELSSQKATVVFTSVNAVTAVCSLFSEPPPWSIYCMENATLNLVRTEFSEASVAGYASDATSLASKIIADKLSESIVFFCGNLRRDELPGLLQQNGIKVEQVVVYETQLTPVALNNKYNGILFYSPSGAESFFSLNKLGSDTTLFAIGETTAAALRRLSSNNIIVSQRPGKLNLVEAVIAHYKTLNLEDDSEVTK